MCYHVSTPDKLNLSQLAQNTGKDLFSDYERTYHVNGFSRPWLPVTLSSDQDSISAAKWKLIPSWAANEDAVKWNTLNARAETIFTQSSYKSYILKNKGVLYVDGFWEPHLPKGEKVTESHYIFTPGHTIFRLGIVYSPFTDKSTGERFNTFAIITVEANPLLRSIHNSGNNPFRMPLIIKEEDEQHWLNETTQNSIETYFQPYSGDLESYRTKRVTAPKRGENTNVEASQIKE